MAIDLFNSRGMSLENYSNTRIVIACSFRIAVRTNMKPQKLLWGVQHKTGTKQKVLKN